MFFLYGVNDSGMKTFDLHGIRGPGQGKSLAFLFASVCRFEQKVLLTLRQVNLTIIFGGAAAQCRME